MFFGDVEVSVCRIALARYQAWSQRPRDELPVTAGVTGAALPFPDARLG